MNEKLNRNAAISSRTNDTTEVIKRILANAMKTRGVCEPSYRPFKKLDYVNYSAPLGWQRVDFSGEYPNAQNGDFVVSEFDIFCRSDSEISLNVAGRIEVWYNGERICDMTDSENIPAVEKIEDLTRLHIKVKKGKGNRVRIVTVKGAEAFGFCFMLTTLKYAHMWANDYLYDARAVLPVENGEYEEGIAFSECISADKRTAFGERGYNGVQYRPFYNVPDGEKFDFDRLCGRGDACYVYTEAHQKHTLTYSGAVDLILIGGRKYAGALDGRLEVDAGDKILFRCPKRDGEWQLSLGAENIGLPWLKSCRSGGISAIYAGPFYGNHAHAPEFGYKLCDVFTNERGEKLYWGFCDGSQLRIYLDSVFFGQWFYALMVGFYGIRRAAELCGLDEYYKMFCDNMRFLADHFDYIKLDIERNTMPAFMPRISDMKVLDNVGTMGMNLIDAYLTVNDGKILRVIREIADNVMNEIPRFPDGTFYRIDTMWADDLFMSCPFLVRMGVLTGEKAWYDEALRQLEGFAKRQYMEDEQLFSHIFFPDTGLASRVPWGRGNGWVMWTISEILIYADGKTDTSFARDLFVKLANGLRRVQDKTGLWRQVLNRDDEASYTETSCTAMFLLALTRGIRYGWLGEEFRECADRAWRGLINHSIDIDGNIYGVCQGSGCSMESEYYCILSTIANDDHGTGIVLAAAAEYGELIGS